MTYKIQLNQTGTHSLEITGTNLATIKKFSLFKDLVDSNGYVDDIVLNKLKYNVRSLISNSEDNCKDLLDLCIDVIYHEKMKAYGLIELIKVYKEWEAQLPPEVTPSTEQPEA